MESFVPARISVRRGGAEVPLMPGRGNVLSQVPQAKLIGERHRVGNLEIPEHEHESFCLHFQLSGAPNLEWWCNGRHGIEKPTAGALILLPSGTRDRARWEGVSERIMVSLDANVVREVSQQIRSSSEPEPFTICSSRLAVNLKLAGPSALSTQIYLGRRSPV